MVFEDPSLSLGRVLCAAISAQVVRPRKPSRARSGPAQRAAPANFPGSPLAEGASVATRSYTVNNPNGSTSTDPNGLVLEPLRVPPSPVVAGEHVRVVAAAILERGRLLLVSKRPAPEVFYLPGGKPDPDEHPDATLARELEEELGVALVSSEPFAVIRDQAALERARLEMDVYLATVAGSMAPRAEIEEIAWVGADGQSPGVLAPAIRNQVLPRLAALGLIA